MSDYKIQDFTRCPASSCDNVGPVELDYYWDGSRVFLNFICPDCIYSASEDDFEHHVRCPDCHGNLEENSCIGRVESIDGGVTEEEGKVWFECSNCGNDAEGYISTKWDAAQS